MANNLQFTAAVSVANLQKCKVLQVLQIDEDASIMLVQIQVQGGGGVLQRRDPWVLAIKNGSADALVVNPAPICIQETMISVGLSGAGLASAFTSALAAYRATGADRRGALMTALQGLSGTVVQAPSEAAVLLGTTIPILPAGTVS